MVDKPNGQNEDDKDLCLFIMFFCACIATSAHYYYYDGMTGNVYEKWHKTEIPNGKTKCQMISTKWKKFFKKL